MKKTILIFAPSICGMYSFAQREKTATYFSGKTEFLDDSGKVERSDEGKVVVKVSKAHITAMYNDDDNDTLEGTVTDAVCDWKIPFENDITKFNTNLFERSGESNNAVVSIEGKGKACNSYQF